MLRTGPKTPRGKAVSSRNAFKHGIRSSYVVVNDFEELTECIALNFWRRRRVDYFQAAVTRSWVDGAGGLCRTSGNHPARAKPTFYETVSRC